MNKLITVTALTAALPLSMESRAQQADVTSEELEPEKPYEIVITGRPTRSRLRELIVEVEEDFFAKYNELNQDNAYDMYCYEYTPTMSHIRKRACEPLFMLSARSENISDVVWLLGSPYASTQGSAYLEDPEIMRKNHRRYYAILVRKMEELAQSNKELGQIASVMEQLKFRMENYNEQ